MIETENYESFYGLKTFLTFRFNCLALHNLHALQLAQLASLGHEAPVGQHA